MTWMAGLGGRRVDLLHPIAAQVDFDEIAHALAHLNRYGGHTDEPVSVAKHTLIIVDALDAFVAAKRMTEERARALRPHVLLHDAHEARLGDWTTPLKHTLWAAAQEIYGDQGRMIVAATVRRLFERHDRAIYLAAGLARPSAEEETLVRALDVAAIPTERAAFWSRSPDAPAWSDLIESAPPLPAPRKSLATLGPDQVAVRLRTEFHATLPVFTRKAAR